jgi:DNA-binding response OmpR family regulator
MNRGTKILLAEDDLNIGNLLTDYLRTEKFDVTLVPDGEVAINAFHKFHFDLCILDVMMPRVDGFTVAETIRKENKLIPIIFITAKSLKQDKIKGYSIGGDDYIIKPFDEEELLLKINAIVRRSNHTSHQGDSMTINIGKYIFDFRNQSLFSDGNLKRITEKESNILKYLYEHKNRIIKRDEMLKALWGENDYFLGRSLDVFITKLRKYLNGDPQVNIENVFGVGFIFNIPDGNSGNT